MRGWSSGSGHPMNIARTRTFLLSWTNDRARKGASLTYRNNHVSKPGPAPKILTFLSQLRPESSESCCSVPIAESLCVPYCYAQEIATFTHRWARCLFLWSLRYQRRQDNNADMNPTLLSAPMCLRTGTDSHLAIAVCPGR